MKILNGIILSCCALLTGFQSVAYADEVLRQVIKAGTGGQYKAECQIDSRHFEKWGEKIKDVSDHTLSEKVSLTFEVMTGATVLPWIQINDKLQAQFPNRDLRAYPSGIRGFQFENFSNKIENCSTPYIDSYRCQQSSSNTVTRSGLEYSEVKVAELWNSRWEERVNSKLSIDRFGSANHYTYVENRSRFPGCPTGSHCLAQPDLEKHEYAFDCKLTKM